MAKTSKPKIFEGVVAVRLTEVDLATLATLRQQRGLSTSEVLRALVRQARGAEDGAEAPDVEAVPVDS